MDDESKRQLATLGRFGFMSMLENVIKEDDQSRDCNGDSEEEGTKSPTAEDYSDITELAEDEGGPYVDDAVLMPPPPTPSSKTPTMSSDAKKKLETPLAAMLPSKYANIDVRELFPDFRPDKVLCFSRLFGPGKPSSLPQIWRGVKKKRKKKKTSESEDFVEEEVEPKDIVFQFGPNPQPDECAIDDNERFLKPLEDSDAGNVGKNPDDEKGPSIADWRFGPAQLWYDILGVPETGKFLCHCDFVLLPCFKTTRNFVVQARTLIMDSKQNERTLRRSKKRITLSYPVSNFPKKHSTWSRSLIGRMTLYGTETISSTKSWPSSTQREV